MHKYLLIISLSIFTFLFTSCDNNPVSSLKQAEFLPMAVGNSWTFVESTVERKTEVIGNAAINGKDYFVLERYYPAMLMGHVDYFLLREAARNKIYINVAGKEFLYADFTRPLNESWQSYDGYTARIVQKDFSLETPGGTFSHSVEIEFSKGARKFSAVFAKGVGFVSDRGWQLKSFTWKN